MKLTIRRLVATLLLATTALTGLSAAQAAPDALGDQQAQAALDALYASAPGARALGDRAKAVLVFPDIHKAAFLVGARSGEGVMFSNGEVAGHYRVDGLLAGLEAGAQSYAYALFFMSDGALQNLRADKGFEIGIDPNIVIVDVGAAKDISTTTAQADVYGYVFDQKGLMGGLGLEGMKITRTGP